MKPVHCCEGHGYGHSTMPFPDVGYVCGKNSSTWTMKTGKTDLSLCMKKCTSYICESKKCDKTIGCHMNRYNTCGLVPEEWKRDNCKILSDGNSQYFTSRFSVLVRYIFLITINMFVYII